MKDVLRIPFSMEALRRDIAIKDRLFPVEQLPDGSLPTYDGPLVIPVNELCIVVSDDEEICEFGG